MRRPSDVLVSLALLLGVIVATPGMTAQLWIDRLNYDSSMPPNGYRYPSYMGNDLLVEMWTDSTPVIQLELRVNGAATFHSCDTWNMWCYAILPYSCGKVTIKARALIGLQWVESHPVEVFLYDDPECLPRRQDCELEAGGQLAGGPVDVTTGGLFYQTTDAALSGPFGLRFERRYESRSGHEGDLGYGWRHSYSAQLELGSGQVVFTDEKGRRVYFNGVSPGNTSHDWTSGADLHHSPTGTYTLTAWSGQRYEFDAAGRLTQLLDRAGNTQTVVRDALHRIEHVEDSLGRRLDFAYDAENRITAVASQPEGVTLAFGYTPSGACPAGNLCSATLPDATTWQYEYTDPDDPHNLTRVVDPLGHTAEENEYDSQDRVTAQQAEGGVNRLAFQYGTTTTTVTDALSRTTTYTFDPDLYVVTDVAGPACECGPAAERHFEYDVFLRRLSERTGSDPNALTTWEYGRDVTIPRPGDPYGPFTEVVAVYPSPTSRTEALNASESRTTTWQYYPTTDPRRDLVDVEYRPSVDAPGESLTVDLVYSTAGLLTARHETGFVSGVAETHTTSYSYDARGRLTSVDGPRTDVADVRTTTYYPDDDPDLARRGQPHTRVSPGGLVTTYASHAPLFDTYDVYGNAKSVTDPNGVVTAREFDTRGRLVTETLKAVPDEPTDIITHRSYDAAGRLELVRRGRGNGIRYAWDAAGRLTDTVLVDTGDRQLERRHQVFNDMSETAMVELQRCVSPAFPCTQWTTHYRATYRYDALGRLEFIDHPDGFSVHHEYDTAGNLWRVTDERHVQPNVVYGYDLASRLTEVNQTLSGVPGGVAVTAYHYDVLDNLTAVVDAEGNLTTYTPDDFGRTRVLSSPATGMTTFGYDPAGNLTGATRPSGRALARSYDALNRPLEETASLGAATETTSWAYDSGAYGKGHMTREYRSDGSGEVYRYLDYDRRGNLREEKAVYDGTSYSIWRTYDANGNRTSLALESDVASVELKYGYDQSDRLSGVSLLNPYVQLVRGATHLPFGPVDAYSAGDEPPFLRVTRAHDLRYRLSSVTVREGFDLASRSYQHADGLNITSWTEPVRSCSFGYDDLSRLTTASCGATGWGYSYDAIGNRESRTVAGPSSESWTYQYPVNAAGGNAPTLEELTDTIAAISYVAHHDRDGSLTRVEASGGPEELSFSYSPDMLVETHHEGTTTTAFRHDARGYLATMSRDDGETVERRHFLYDLDGAPLAALNPDLPDATDSFFVFAEGMPVGVVQPNASPSVWRVVSDHVGAPALYYASEQRYTRVWYAPFGSIAEIEQVGGPSPPLQLRFPGQLDLSIPDSEWPVFYNIHRWYMPEWGRYTQSDPLPVDSMVHLFAYASGNPFRFVDPQGLQPMPPSGCPHPPVPDHCLCDEWQLGHQFKDDYRSWKRWEKVRERVQEDHVRCWCTWRLAGQFEAYRWTYVWVAETVCFPCFKGDPVYVFRSDPLEKHYSPIWGGEEKTTLGFGTSGGCNCSPPT